MKKEEVLSIIKELKNENPYIEGVLIGTYEGGVFISLGLENEEAKRFAIGIKNHIKKEVEESKIAKRASLGIMIKNLNGHSVEAKDINDKYFILIVYKKEIPDNKRIVYGTLNSIVEKLENL